MNNLGADRKNIPTVLGNHSRATNPSPSVASGAVSSTDLHPAPGTQDMMATSYIAQDRRLTKEAPPIQDQNLVAVADVFALFLLHIRTAIEKDATIPEVIRALLLATIPANLHEVESRLSQHTIYFNFYKEMQEVLAQHFTETFLDLSLIALPLAQAAQSAQCLNIFISFLNTPRLDTPKKQVGCLNSICLHLQEMVQAIAILHDNLNSLISEHKSIANNSDLQGLFTNKSLLEGFIEHWQQELTRYVAQRDALLSTLPRTTSLQDMSTAVSSSSSAASTSSSISSTSDNRLVTSDGPASVVEPRKQVNLANPNIANTVNQQGDTMLHIAAKGGNPAVAVTCLMLGCDVNALNNERKPAIAYALDKVDVLLRLFCYLPKLSEMTIDVVALEKYQSPRLAAWRERVKGVTNLETLVAKWSFAQVANNNFWWLNPANYHTQQNDATCLEQGLDALKMYQMLLALIDTKKRKELLLNIDNADIFRGKAELSFKKVQDDYLRLRESYPHSPGLEDIYRCYQDLYDDVAALADDCETIQVFIRELMLSRTEMQHIYADIIESIMNSSDMLRAQFAKIQVLLKQGEKTSETLVANKLTPISPKKREGYDSHAVQSNGSPLRVSKEKNNEHVSYLLGAALFGMRAQSELSPQPSALGVGEDEIRNLKNLLNDLESVVSRVVLVLNAYMNYLTGLSLKESMRKQFNLHHFMASDAENIHTQLLRDQLEEAQGGITVKLFIGTFNALPESAYHSFVRYVARVVASSQGDFEAKWMELETFLAEEKAKLQVQVEQNKADVQKKQQLTKLEQCTMDWKTHKVFFYRYVSLVPDGTQRWQNIVASKSVQAHEILKQHSLQQVLTNTSEVTMPKADRIAAALFTPPKGGLSAGVGSPAKLSASAPVGARTPTGIPIPYGTHASSSSSNTNGSVSTTLSRSTSTNANASTSSSGVSRGGNAFSKMITPATSRGPGANN